MFATIAQAMAPGGAPGGGQGGGLMNTLILVVPMILIFYFLLIRPQSKRAKEQQKYLDELKKGDDVITAGGVYGRIVGLSDKVITLEIAEKVRIRVARSQISGSQPTESSNPT